MLLDRSHSNKPDMLPSITVDHPATGKHGAGSWFSGQTSGQLAYTRVTQLTWKSFNSKYIHLFRTWTLENRVWPWKVLEVDVGGGLGLGLVAYGTNNWKVVGSRPAKVVWTVYQCWQVTTWGKLSAVAGYHSFFRAVRSWSLRLSAFDGLGFGMGKWKERKADAMLTLSSAL